MIIYHPMCLAAITSWMNGKISGEYAAYICNMVDSRNLELAKLVLSSQW